MFLHYLHAQAGRNHFHSTDLDDMRRALVDEDEDGPDGGSADVSNRARRDGSKAPDAAATHPGRH